MYDLDLLRPIVTFAMVVETGSFKGAAERLGLSAPYVSQMISDLEARLGRQLLYRSTRRVSLTDSGERFLTHAKTLAEAFQEGIAEVRQEKRSLSGSLRVSAPTVLVSPVFARFVQRFARRHSALRLQIDFDDKAVDPVASRIDLAIRIGDPGDDPRLARRLFSTRGLVCCSTDEAGEIGKPGDLENRLWLRSPITQDGFQLSGPGNKKAKVIPGSQLVINNAAMIRSMLLESGGFALFPEFVVRDALASGNLVNPLPGWSIPDVTVHALFTERRTALANARAFVDELVLAVANLKASNQARRLE